MPVIIFTVVTIIVGFLPALPPLNLEQSWAIPHILVLMGDPTSDVGEAAAVLLDELLDDRLNWLQ